MDFLCAYCLQNVSKETRFHRSFDNNHDNVLREKSFCSIKCMDKWIVENDPPCLREKKPAENNERNIPNFNYAPSAH